MNVEFDVRNWEGANAFVRTVFRDQIPFATSVAINRTAIAFQRDQRNRMEDIFTIRRKRFMERSVKIKPFARKHSLEARIAIDSPGGRSDIFAKFENQDFKGPFRGRSVAVPTEHVARTPTGVIRKGWRPSELLDGAAQHGEGRVLKRRGDVYQGKKRTFLIRRPGGRGTIFQRQRGGDVVPLYQLVPRVSLPPDLEFVETATKTVNREWDEQFARAFDSAIKTARY